jgi:hypothetical protein
MQASDGSLTLTEFAQTHAAGRTHRRWVDQLPDELVTQIVGSETPPSVVIAWLESLGYENATPAKVKPLIVQRNRP